MLLFFVSSQFAATIQRTFSVRYDPYTQSVQVINTMNQVTSFTTDIIGMTQSDGFTCASLVLNYIHAKILMSENNLFITLLKFPPKFVHPIVNC